MLYVDSVNLTVSIVSNDSLATLLFMSLIFFLVDGTGYFQHQSSNLFILFCQNFLSKMKLIFIRKLICGCIKIYKKPVMGSAMSLHKPVLGTS